MVPDDEAYCGSYLVKPQKEILTLFKMFWPESTWFSRIVFWVWVFILVWPLLLTIEMETPANILWSQLKPSALRFKQKNLNNTHKNWSDIKDFCCSLQNDYVHHLPFHACTGIPYVCYLSDLVDTVFNAVCLWKRVLRDVWSWSWEQRHCWK